MIKEKRLFFFFLLPPPPFGGTKKSKTSAWSTNTNSQLNAWILFFKKQGIDKDYAGMLRDFKRSHMLLFSRHLQHRKNLDEFSQEGHLSQIWWDYCIKTDGRRFDVERYTYTYMLYMQYTRTYVRVYSPYISSFNGTVFVLVTIRHLPLVYARKKRIVSRRVTITIIVIIMMILYDTFTDMLVYKFKLSFYY